MLGFGTHLHSMMKTFGFPQKFIFKAHKKKITLMPSFAFSISRLSKNLLHLLFPFEFRKRASKVLSKVRSDFGQCVFATLSYS